MRSLPSRELKDLLDEKEEGRVSDGLFYSSMVVCLLCVLSYNEGH